MVHPRIQQAAVFYTVQFCDFVAKSFFSMCDDTRKHICTYLNFIVHVYSISTSNIMLITLPIEPRNLIWCTRHFREGPG